MEGPIPPVLSCLEGPVGDIPPSFVGGEDIIIEEVDPFPVFDSDGATVIGGTIPSLLDSGMGLTEEGAPTFGWGEDSSIVGGMVTFVGWPGFSVIEGDMTAVPGF